MHPTLDARRSRAAAAWNLADEIVLVAAGEPVPIPGGADQTYPFLAHSEYVWLCDREVPGAVAAFDPLEGWFDFVPRVTDSERIWEGREQTAGLPIDELAPWLASRRGRPITILGAGLAGMPGQAPRTAELRDALTHTRRPKDATEVDRIRAAARATAAGFEAAREWLRAGVTERDIRIAMEAAFQRAGADGVGYGTIVAAGSHAAVLHFEPGDQTLEAGAAVLIDAGAQVRRYCADVTRTYAVPGGDPGFLRDLHAVVLEVERRAIAGCVVGAEWRALHLEAAHRIAEGLVSLGVLRGQPESLVARDTHALFFPHGLGHMVGLGVRDAGGYLPGRERSTRPGLSMLRTDLPLEAGYVMTVEPGIYFIAPLLHDRANRERHADAVHWDRVDALMRVGGVRIEDDVLVTAGAPDVLTAAIPTAL